MGDGDDSPLGPPTNDQALEVALKLRGGSGSCPNDLAQHGADIAIARCGFAAFALAGRFVVARTEAGPLGESVGGYRKRPCRHRFPPGAWRPPSDRYRGWSTAVARPPHRV